MVSREVNSVGIGVVALGFILGWAGIRNVPVLEAFKALAMGKAPTPHPKPAWEPLTFDAGSAPAGGAGGAVPAAGDAGKVLSIAASFKGQRYCFGGGHGAPCAGSCSDCSGYVSCVLNKAGLMKGTMATGGLARYGTAVPFAQRAPGDIVVWNGGPGGGHCGIVLDGKRMWHNPCTGCGGVTIGSYGSTRTGRTTVVRRPKAA